jgi:protein-L-isoaspartate O-methyltransferase
VPGAAATRTWRLGTGRRGAGACPFDRIVATGGLDQVPQAWIDQTRDGGKILVNVLGAWNLFTPVLLTVHGDTASGRFLRQLGGFVPRRTDRARAHDYTVRVCFAGRHRSRRVLQHPGPAGPSEMTRRSG